MWKINLRGLMLAIAMATILHLPLQVQAQPVPLVMITDPIGKAVPRDQVLAELAQTQVIYLGETHDRAADHAAQLDIITAIQSQSPLVPLTIGMEMFQRPSQPALDDYLADRITESELLEKTAYATQWGFDWEFYAPIVRFAKANQMPIVALNAPSALVRQVGRKGFASLSMADQQFIPAVEVLNEGLAISAPAYRQMLRETFEAAHQGKGNADRFERFFAAQVLWDETMADRIAETVKTQPGQKIVVLVGQGHVVYGYGIPSRVKRRLPEVSQKILLLNPETPTPPGDLPIADLFWRNE